MRVPAIESQLGTYGVGVLGSVPNPSGVAAPDAAAFVVRIRKPRTPPAAERPAERALRHVAVERSHCDVGMCCKCLGRILDEEP